MTSQDESNHDETERRRLPSRWMSNRRARALIGVGLAVVGAAGLLAWGTASREPARATTAAPAGTDAAGDPFAYLAAQDTNYCSLDAATVLEYRDDVRMQGSCCDSMDRDKYRQQLDGLRRYAHIPEIPQDPYDIEAGQAKELLRYDETITLTGQEQATFDQAMAMTEDGGPCCCQCWRWYMTQGLAKFLITHLDMPAEEVAEVADLTNGCGGGSHEDESSG